MSGVRRAIFAILIALLAFAIGIALGNGPLQSDDKPDNSVALEKANRVLRDRTAALRQGAAFDASVNTALADRLLEGRLSGRSVTLVVLPRVPDDTVTA